MMVPKDTSESLKEKKSEKIRRQTRKRAANYRSNQGEKLKEKEKSCLAQCYQTKISMLRHSVIGKVNWTEQFADSIKRSLK